MLRITFVGTNEDGEEDSCSGEVCALDTKGFYRSASEPVTQGKNPDEDGENRAAGVFRRKTDELTERSSLTQDTGCLLEGALARPD
jgi:hypothetical protein